jgi:5'-methylthioadenosine phosphorylase
MTGTRQQVKPTVGIIGGSGLYDIEGMAHVREIAVRTPFGPPSDVVVTGVIGGTPVAFLSRHGRGHRVNPTAINYRANLYALKSVGVQRVISVSAVGSMKEGIKPGDVVLPDQFIDLTKRRPSTFFDEGIVAHVAFAEPICRSLSQALAGAAEAVGATTHRGGSYICIEGPQFSTKAESLLYRTWGVDVIGMTNMPEAKLAREAELCYATVALATDYDCWHETEECVSVEAILATLQRNVALAKDLLRKVIPDVGGSLPCACNQALRNAIVTPHDRISAAARRRLGLLINRYIGKPKRGR